MKIRGCAATVKPENYTAPCSSKYPEQEFFCRTTLRERGVFFMKKKIFIGIGVVILVFGLVWVKNNSKKRIVEQIIVSSTVRPTIIKTTQDQFSYKGQTGKDA